MKNIPNPMYFFSRNEKEKLISLFSRRADSTNQDVRFLELDFNYNARLRPEDSKRELLSQKKTFQGNTNKLVYSLFFPTTLKLPHHINKNGEREDKPNREGPMRTYFDGSKIETLGHAVAMCVDNEKRIITTQCPQGYDFPNIEEQTVQEVYPDYERVTLKHKQQQDSHSCVPLTLHNMFAMAGFHPAQESIDIEEWRKELLGILEDNNVKSHPFYAYNGDGNLNVIAQHINKHRYKHSNPIFEQRYTPQDL